MVLEFGMQAELQASPREIKKLLCGHSGISIFFILNFCWFPFGVLTIAFLMFNEDFSLAHWSRLLAAAIFTLVLLIDLSIHVKLMIDPCADANAKRIFLWIWITQVLCFLYFIFFVIVCTIEAKGMAVVLAPILFLQPAQRLGLALVVQHIAAQVLAKTLMKGSTITPSKVTVPSTSPRYDQVFSRGTLEMTGLFCVMWCLALLAFAAALYAQDSSIPWSEIPRLIMLLTLVPCELITYICLYLGFTKTKVNLIYNSLYLNIVSCALSTTIIFYSFKEGLKEKPLLYAVYLPVKLLFSVAFLTVAQEMLAQLRKEPFKTKSSSFEVNLSPHYMSL